jgi:membrane associated rhomboid family serine protease
MPSGADLFVVCKHCGSEVSPYITECPYCGHRLRRRAPKLPRARGPARPPRRSSRLRRLLARPSERATTEPSPWRGGYAPSRWEERRPYATIAIVVASVGLWIAWHARPQILEELELIGQLHKHWWRLFGYQLVYHNGLYAFVVITTIALFGWLLERRHGPVVVLALFFGAGAAGGLAALAAYPAPLTAGGNAGALALLAAWAAPDIRAARTGVPYEGDLLGAAVIAALVLAMPFVVFWAGWLPGVTGGVIGLAVGSGLRRLAQAQR